MLFVKTNQMNCEIVLNDSINSFPVGSLLSEKAKNMVHRRVQIIKGYEFIVQKQLIYIMPICVFGRFY